MRHHTKKTFRVDSRRDRELMLKLGFLYLLLDQWSPVVLSKHGSFDAAVNSQQDGMSIFCLNSNVFVKF